MLYKCECGCGAEVEKTIASSQACRMRIRRDSVTKHNENVTEDNIDDTEALQNVTEAYQDEYEVEQMPCRVCNTKAPYDENRDGYYCKKCGKTSKYE